MRGFLRIMLFVVVGPFVGLLAMSVLVGSYTLVTQGSARDFTFGPQLFAPTILIVTYMIGSGPALLTAVATIFIGQRWRMGPAGWAITALVGAVISLVAALVLFGRAQTAADDSTQMIVLMTLTGAIAGFACSALFDGLAALLGRRRVAA